eukprot:scaffold1015_cov141-Amphora_coffeaeformis.AAC.3
MAYPSMTIYTIDQQRVSPQLHRALVESAAQAGFQIFSNGTSYTKGTLQSRKKFPLNSTPPQGSVTYVCNRYDLYSKPFTEDGEKDDDEMTSKTFRGVRLGELSRGMSSPASGRNYLHSVFDADNARHYFGEQAGPSGLLGWLEEHKNDTSYCVWQASPQSLELPSMERNANIIFNEETIDGTTTKTDLTEMCRDVIKEYQQEVENLKMKKEQGKEAVSAISSCSQSGCP